jgi:hypothetical protein
MPLAPELKSKIDALWDKFWSGGLSNPLSSIEQQHIEDLFSALMRVQGGNIRRWAGNLNLSPNNLINL